MQKKESENEILNGIQSHYAQYAKLAKRPYMRYQMKRHQILSKLSRLEDFSSKKSISVRPPYLNSYFSLIHINQQALVKHGN